MATHTSILAWEIPWTEEPGRLQSMGSQRVGHDLCTLSIYDGCGKIYSVEKTTSSISSVGKNWTVTCKRIKIGYSLTPSTKTDSKWMKDLNVRWKP